jgi:hypothetical protein
VGEREEFDSIGGNSRNMEMNGEGFPSKSFIGQCNWYTRLLDKEEWRMQRKEAYQRSIQGVFSE